MYRWGRCALGKVASADAEKGDSISVITCHDRRTRDSGRSALSGFLDGREFVLILPNGVVGGAE